MSRTEIVNGQLNPVPAQRMQGRLPKIGGVDRTRSSIHCPMSTIRPHRVELAHARASVTSVSACMPAAPRTRAISLSA
jgi:hypothetical protein